MSQKKHARKNAGMKIAINGLERQLRFLNRFLL